MIKKCNNCGKTFEKNGRYCPSCGYDTGDLIDEETVKSNDETSKNNKSIIIGFILIFVCVIAMIIGGVFLERSNQVGYDDDLNEAIALELPQSEVTIINYESDYYNSSSNEVQTKIVVKNVERLGTYCVNDDKGQVDLKFTVLMIYNSEKGVANNSYIKYQIKNSSGIIVEVGKIDVPEIDEGETIIVNEAIGELSEDESYSLCFYN